MSLFSFNFFIEESNDLVCIVGTDAFSRRLTPLLLNISKEELLGTFSIFSTSKDLERSLHEIESCKWETPP
jgi:hypothetical protein